MKKKSLHLLTFVVVESFLLFLWTTLVLEVRFPYGLYDFSGKMSGHIPTAPPLHDWLLYLLYRIGGAHWTFDSVILYWTLIILLVINPVIYYVRRR